MGNLSDFEAIKQNGYTNILKYRGEKQRSGISYDYMDKLNEFVDQGIFVDAKGDGFTNSEKAALEKELFKIHKEHNYSTDFHSMLTGTKTEYSYNDFIRLAESAGYVLKEEEKTKMPQEAVAKPLKAKVDIPTPQAEMAEEIKPNAGSNINNIKEEKTGTNTDYAEAKIIADLDSNPELVGKSGEERANILTSKRSDLTIEKHSLQKTKVQYETKGFLGLFKKTKERDLTAEETAQRQERIAQIDTEIDKINKDLAYVNHVQAKKFWSDRYASQKLMDENGNIIEEYPSFDQVTLTAPDGKEVRALRVNNYNPETLEYDYKYYTIDVKKVGDPNIGKGLYYSIVPDMDNELTGYEDKTVR